MIELLLYIITYVPKNHLTKKTHGAFDARLANFREYIKSHFMEDSWLIRSLTGAPINSALDKRWTEMATNFLLGNNFKISDIRGS